MYHKIASVFDKIEIAPEHSEQIRNNLLASYASKTTKTKPCILRKKAFVLAATLTIFLLFSGFTYGAVKYIQTVFGLQMRISECETGGVEISGEYIGELNPPAEIIDGRLIFTLDGSNRDITNQCSETTYFRYDMVDEKGIQHIIFIGGTIDDWGFGDMIWDEEFQTYYGHFVGNSYESPEWMRNANSSLYGCDLE